MIDYFSQTLTGILNSRHTLAKDKARKEYDEALAAHPELKEKIKQKKFLELQIAKCTALKQPCDDAAAKLAATEKDISDYVKATGIKFSSPYSCRLCKDTGFVNKQPCKCITEDYNRLLRENCSLSPMPQFTFADNAFSESDAPQAAGMNKLYRIMLKVCDKFCSTKLQNFLFCGASGVGKTSLAAAVANELLKNNVSVLYLSSFELVNIFLDKHTRKDTAFRKAYDYVQACEMLIVDNLGAEPVYKNVTIEYLLSTIDKRLGENKKTMLLTQLDGVQLVGRYGEALLSKFADKKYALSVGYIQGEDLRKL